MSSVPAGRKYKFYLNDEERDNYQRLLGSAEPMRAEDEYYFKIMHWDEEKEKQYHKDKYKSKRTRTKKKPPAAAKKKKPQPVNEDGFPLRLCEYEPTEFRQVYRPPGYGKEADPELPHCLSCHLKPCITEEFHDEARGFLNDKHCKDDMAIPAAQKLTSVFLHKKHCKLMKKRYLKKLQPPKCITDVCEHFAGVLEKYVVHSSSESDDSDMEEAEFTGPPSNQMTAVDGKEEKMYPTAGKETCRGFRKYLGRRNKLLKATNKMVDDFLDGEEDTEPNPEDVEVFRIKKRRSLSQEIAHGNYVIFGEKGETQDQYENRIAKKTRKDKSSQKKKVAMNAFLDSSSSNSEHEDQSTIVESPESSKDEATKKIDFSNLGFLTTDDEEDGEEEDAKQEPAEQDAMPVKQPSCSDSISSDEENEFTG